MTPHTTHYIAQEIRNWRADLTALEKWARSLESPEARCEVFHRVNFWRRLLNKAEQEIASGRASVG